MVWVLKKDLVLCGLLCLDGEQDLGPFPMDWVLKKDLGPFPMDWVLKQDSVLCGLLYFDC